MQQLRLIINLSKMKNMISGNKELLLIFSILGLLMLLFGAFLKITHYSFGFLTGNLVLSVALFMSFIVWLFVFFDIFRSKTKNSLIWIIGMFLFASITPIIYLIYKK